MKGRELIGVEWRHEPVGVHIHADTEAYLINAIMGTIC